MDSSGDERARQAQETIARETEHMEALEREIDSAEKELISLNAQKEKIAEILRDNQNTAELQRKKQVLEGRLESERKELEACNRLFLDFFSNSAITYFMLPLMDQAETCLVDANVDDRGIRDMTESSIRDIIKRRRCICGAELEVSEDGKTGNSAYLHILEELRYVPPAHIGTAIQNFKQLLTVDRRNVSLFYPTIEQKYKEIQKHRDSIASLEDEIARIDESIFGKENMGSYEADMNRIKENIKRMTEKKARCDRDIGACQSAIESAQKLYDSLVSASERNKKLIAYIAYAEQICNWIDETYAEKEQEMRGRLQERVNDTFGKMYHGQRRVQIDKQSRSKVEEVYGLTTADIRELQSTLSVYYEIPFFNGRSIWHKIQDLPIVKKLQGNDWMLTCIMRQQDSVASISVAGGIILSLESTSLSLSRICEWISSEYGTMSINALEKRFNELFGTRIPASKLAEKLKTSGSWRNVVTDSMDDYIDSLVDADIIDMDANDLLHEEFF